MMILSSLLLAMQAASPEESARSAPPPEVTDQILVISERLKSWKGGLYKKDGKLTCRIKQSTGDREIDAIRCGALLGCFAPKAAEMDAASESDLPEAEREKRMQKIAESTKPCLELMHRRGTSKLAEMRTSL